METEHISPHLQGPVTGEGGDYLNISVQRGYPML